MTIHAAGILFTNNKHALFLLRGAGGDYPGCWCFPGGKTDGDETPEETAERETIEEIGHLPDGARRLWTRSQTAGAGNAVDSGEATQPLPGSAALGTTVDFTTFLQPVADQFIPEFDAEHVGYAWAPIDQPPQPLHPGCQIALDRFDMDELGIARAIVAGRLTSPQVYENISLFDIRITGTGVAFRQALDEFVMRNPEIYLNDEFLARCNGLPVIIEHPPTDVLTTKEFADRIIGTVFMPYIKGDEVWAIAKIYDQPAAQMMADEQLSTSPAVVFRGSGVNDKMTLEDGSTLLIEGKPSLLDHLAVCAVGVWDKGSDPVGVTSEEIRSDSVAPVSFWEKSSTHSQLDAALSKVGKV